VHYILLIMLSFIGVSGVLDTLPVPYRPGFQQSLHAYVQVNLLTICLEKIVPQLEILP